jgi:hypothetical protein
MAKIELKGTLTGVGAVELVGDRKMQKQCVVVECKAFIDDYGDAKGKDEQWLLEVIGDNVANLNLSEKMVGSKGKFTVFVESRLVVIPATDIINETNFYKISAKLWKTEFKV